jgi:dihydroflavonol-4-reductase
MTMRTKDGITVVTGASGHIGGNLARALLAQGRRLRLLVREDRRAVEGLAAELVMGDVTDPGSLARALQGADVVYHLAARISIVGEEGGLVQRTNVLGTRNVVEACLAAGVKRLGHFSSIHAFSQDPLEQPLDETRAPVPGKGSPAYDRSKAAGEQEIRAGLERGLDAVIVNPTAVLGPFDFKPSRMGEVIRGLSQRRFLALIEGGFDWVDVRDVAAGAIAAEERGRRGEKYLLSGHWLSLRELAGLVEEISGTRAPAWTSPTWLAHLGAPFVTAWSKMTGKQPLYTTESLYALRANRAISHDKATRELGYSPRPLRETVEDALRWFREHGGAA